MPQEGMLLQLDGSHHRWLEDRGPVLTLLLAVDDATGRVPYALFRKQEDTQGYLLLLRGIIERCGIPLAVYTDRHAVFRHWRHGPHETPVSLDVGASSTQCARALRELGVTQVFAHSPEAKGRVERTNGTFQDRLVAELRLAGASTLIEANRVLGEFLTSFNQRFGVPAAQSGSAYREVQEGLDIDGVLCIKEIRRVAKDNTVRYRGRTLQLFPGSDQPSYAWAHVEVQERLDGRLIVCYRGKLLTPEEHLLLPLNSVRGHTRVLRTVVWECQRTPVCLPLSLRSVQTPGSRAPPWAGMGIGIRTTQRSASMESWCRQGWSEHDNKVSESEGPR